MGELIAPAWKDIPDSPGIYWCCGQDDVYDTIRIAKIEDELYAFFFGIDKMIKVEDLKTAPIKKCYGPLTLADKSACIIYDNGFYQEHDPPKEPNNEFDS